MRGQRGSFLGFTFNDIHSSVFGITRTSDGTRNNQNLIPTCSDNTLEVPGADGAIYVDSTFDKVDFTINYAFDGVTEDQLQSMKMIWNDKKIHDFIYDEYPYKVYSAKLTGTSQIKHLAFVENGQRLYKGEGSLVFTCYFPYARSRFEYIEDYHEGNIPEWLPDDEFWQLQLKLLEKRHNKELAFRMSKYIEYDFFESPKVGKLESFDEVGSASSAQYGILKPMKSEYNNLDEWKNASGIPNRETTNWSNSEQFELYNAGDAPADITFWVVKTIDQEVGIENNTITNKNSSSLLKLKIQDEEEDVEIKYLKFDFRNCVIEECDKNRQPTGKIYNSAITEGDFFKIPRGTTQFHKIGDWIDFEMKYYYV